MGGVIPAETSEPQVSASEKEMLLCFAANFLAYPGVSMPITLGKITLI